MNLVNKEIYTHIVCAIGTATMFMEFQKLFRLINK